MTEKKKRRAARSRRWWTKHIESWEKSGVTMAEYAKDHGLEIGTLYRWKAKIRPTVKKTSPPKNTTENKLNIDQKPEVKFVEVSVAPPKETPVELIAPNGWAIRFTLGAENAAIAKAISILEERS